LTVTQSGASAKTNSGTVTVITGGLTLTPTTGSTFTVTITGSNISGITGTITFTSGSPETFTGAESFTGGGGGGTDTTSLVGTWTESNTTQDRFVFTSSNVQFGIAAGGWSDQITNPTYTYTGTSLTITGYGSGTAVISNSGQTLTVSGFGAAVPHSSFTFNGTYTKSGSIPPPDEPPGPGTNIAARYQAAKDVYTGGGSLWYGTQYWSYYHVSIHANSIKFYTSSGGEFNSDITISNASTNGGANIYNDVAGLVITTGRWDYVFEGDDIIGFLYDYTVTNDGTPTTSLRSLWLGDSAIVQAPLISTVLSLDPPINADFIQPTAESTYDVEFTDTVL
jgi:hypothetical protein